MIETDRFLIVDDCYNANPMSMKASLDVLKDGAGRRVAILGDMGELGENEVQLHAEVGEHAYVNSKVVTHIRVANKSDVTLLNFDFIIAFPPVKIEKLTKNPHLFFGR